MESPRRISKNAAKGIIVFGGASEIRTHNIQNLNLATLPVGL